MLDEYEVPSISLFDRSIGQTEEIRIIPVVADPNISGLSAPSGTIGISESAMVYQKKGPLDTDWTAGAMLGEVLGGGIDSTTHKGLDQLVHNFAEPGFVEALPLGSFQPDTITAWTNAGKTIKIRETSLTYSNGLVIQAVVNQYNAAGTAILGTLTHTPVYSGCIVQNVTVS
jgi:hypothetical protein